MSKLHFSQLFDISETIATKIFDDIEHPWEALGKIGEFILQLGRTLDPSLFEQKDDNVWIAKSANIAASASITGPCIIDEHAEIRHCAFIRGNVLIGKNCVVGNSSELKNSLLFNNVQVPHYNYVGDSILGYKSHLGAGAITSNVKSDKTNVSVNIEGQVFDTSRKKFGALVGDFVEVGCGSVLNPGTIIGKASSIYPLSMVRGLIPANSIYKKLGEIVEKW